MICKKPYILGTTVPVGCGQCLPCRINRRRVWTARQVLESFGHRACSFVTLTYDQEHLPEDGSLDPKHLQDFMKRLRRRHEPNKVRFFAVGEYGDKSFRPHYHASLFGLGEAEAWKVKESWTKGFSMVASFNETTAQYVAGYTTKKMTALGDPRLKGRKPEFARMSNRPGIGAAAVSVFADAVLCDVGLDEYKETGDVPMRFRLAGKNWPLGKYLRRVLREEVGVPEEHIHAIKQRFFSEKSEEVCSLLSASLLDGEILSASALVSRAALGSIRSIEARDKIFRGKSKL